MINVKSHGSNINLHLLITNLLKAEKAMLRKDYGFDEVFNIFDEKYKKCDNLNKYKACACNKINTKNEMLEYLKTMKNKLIDMFSTPSIIKKVNNANEDPYHV